MWGTGEEMAKEFEGGGREEDRGRQDRNRGYRVVIEENSDDGGT